MKLDNFCIKKAHELLEQHDGDMWSAYLALWRAHVLTCPRVSHGFARAGNAYDNTIEVEDEPEPIGIDTP